MIHWIFEWVDAAVRTFIYTHTTENALRETISTENHFYFSSGGWDTHLIVQSLFFPPPPSFLSTWLYCNRIWWMKGISACLFPIWSSFRCWCSQLIFHTKKKTKNKKKINKSAVFSSVSPRGLHLPPIRKCALQLPVWSKPITGGQSVVCGTCVLFYSPPRPKMSCNSIMCDPLSKC